MARQKILTVVNDFSSGEVDTDLKRGAGSATAMGGRQMSNWRILNSHKKANRPGRSALFLEGGRVEEVLMSPGNKFFLTFGNGYLRVYNAAGAQVFNSTVKGDGSTAIPWTLATFKNIVWVVGAGVVLSIFICYADGAPANVPQVLTWDGVSQTSTWTLSTYTETVEGVGQKRTPFYRLAPQGITLVPGGLTGSVSLMFSANVLTAGMVNTRIRFCNRQILITAVSSGTAGTGTVEEPLPPTNYVTFGSGEGAFQVGDTVTGATSGATGIVTVASGQVLLFNKSSYSGTMPAVGDTVTGATSGATGTVGFVNTSATQFALIINTPTGTFLPGETVNDTTNSSSGPLAVVGAANIHVQLLPNSNGSVLQFEALANEVIVGPNGFGQSLTVSTNTPDPVAVWDQEVMNPYRGYPTSVFFDQGRLGFCNFPALPSGIGWSAIGLPYDFYVDASSADNAIFELAPGKSQVLYVLPGMESSEFIFCDNAIYYIPISQSQPLEPGSVAFLLLSEQGCYPVQPRPAEQTVLYIKAGGLQVGAVQAPGAYYRPYVIDEVAEFHSHLLTASPPIAIAIPSASSQFQELYAYILLANGTLLCGHYSIRQGLLDVGPEGKPKIGWLPWSGAGTVSWIGALGSDVIFCSVYAPGGAALLGVVEKLDNTQYLDGSVLVNNLPVPFTPPGGKGPLYVFPGANATVYLIDLGTRFMGVYTVDANGWIIPQNQGGENLLSSQLVAGQPWTAAFEPFLQDAPAGQDARQRTRRRKVSRAAVSVENSSGFVYATTRVPAYFIGDDATQAAPLREDTYRFRYPGSFFDPRVVLEKDTPGPLVVIEHAVEVSI